MLNNSDFPKILLIPGLNNSGPEHWQTRWESKLNDVTRVQLGGWENPRRAAWVTNLGIAIQQHSGPKILVAHSLGCLAVAWWAMHEPNAAHYEIVGALLVAPPNVDCVPKGSKLADFAPAPKVMLPFDTLLVASENDPYCSRQHAEKLARRWGARFVNAGFFGHINADSQIGEWPYGLSLLDSLATNHNPIFNSALTARIQEMRASRIRSDHFA
jgi:uncharacterized protein